ncbi:hypothetical protein Patl1_12826 [Pistacia atlantica]|uniref:Uncharacterized protein n=1 Tax=Pistacia atlantica TaxID=434234 RepID=A0ACC1ASQ2_9ROSI|nr:hypothetical protein Patl1_12826 [Pistacia atlantica]
MATLLNFTAISVSQQPPESYLRGNRTATFRTKRRANSASFAVNSPESSPTSLEKPEIELEFIGPKAESDGSYPVDRAKAISGEKLLRNIMLDNKIELYATYGKVMNCGGGGSCGTCIVEIIDGKYLLNERTNTELRYLKKASLFLLYSLYRELTMVLIYRSLNLGDLLVKLLWEIKKTLARLLFRGYPSGRSDKETRSTLCQPAAHIKDSW